MQNQLKEMQRVAEMLRAAAKKARIRALYHPTLEKRYRELKDAERIEKHAQDLSSCYTSYRQHGVKHDIKGPTGASDCLS